MDGRVGHIVLRGADAENFRGNVLGVSQEAYENHRRMMEKSSGHHDVPSENGFVFDVDGFGSNFI
jgi:hypothetical protein